MEDIFPGTYLSDGCIYFANMVQRNSPQGVQNNLTICMLITVRIIFI